MIRTSLLTIYSWLSLYKGHQRRVLQLPWFHGTVEASWLGVRGWGCHISRLKNGWRSLTLACMFWELFLFSCFLKFSNDEQCALVFQERYWTSKMHTHIHCSTEALMILQDSGQGKRFTCRHDTVTQPLNYHILKLLTSYCSSIIQA